MYDELLSKIHQFLDYKGLMPAQVIMTYKKLLGEAADAIEELSKELDDMNEANIALYGALPKWIPVTERLPKEMEAVIVTDGKNVGYSFCVNDYGTLEFYSRWNITHWMPLPEPPKEE